MADDVKDGWRAYLLGLLPEEEAVRLEERYFGDDAAFEELELVEDDLIDDYLDRKLDRTDLAAFEQRLRERPELDAHVESRRVLRRAVELQGGRPVSSATRRGPPWLPVAAGLSVAAAILGLGVWRTEEVKAPAPSTGLRQSSSNAAVPPPTAAPRTVSVASKAAVLLLGSAGVRDASSVPTATLEPATTVLTLRLPWSSAEAAAPQVVIEDVDGRALWKGTGRLARQGAQTYAEVSVPAGTLLTGDFIAHFRSSKSEEESFFRIQR